MELFKRNWVVFLTSFISGFALFNLIPFIKVNYGHQFGFILPDSRWCPINYLACYNDYSDGDFPKILIKPLLYFWILPIIVPIFFGIFAVKIKNKCILNV